MNKRNIVLVTGGGGYVGSVLVEKLVKKGFKVRVFDQFYFSRKPLDKIKNKIEIVEGDIRDLPSNIFSNVRDIIHLAALSNDPTAEFSPKANYQINTMAAFNLARKAKLNGVKRFIFGSSASIYDLGMDEGGKIKNEESKVAPKAPYALSKLKAEKRILKLSESDFKVIIFRKGTIFGFSPRMRYDLIVNAMVRSALEFNEIKIFNKGVQWRPLVGLSDVVDIYIKALTLPSKKINGQVFNVSLGNFLVIDVAICVKKILEKNFKMNIRIIYDDGDKNDRSYSIESQKIKRVFHFKPKALLGPEILDIAKKVKKFHFIDFDNSIYYNIAHMEPILKNE